MSTPETPPSAPPAPAAPLAQETAGKPSRDRMARIGPPRRWLAVLRSELRKTTSVKMWWVLTIPVVLLTLMTSPLGSGQSVLLQLVLPRSAGVTSLELMVGSAFVISVVTVVAAMYGALSASGEFRHRTATWSYLTGARIQVLGAKIVVAAGVGALYGLLAAVLGPLLGGAAIGGRTLPDAGDLVLLGLVGIVVSVLWAAIGVAIGTIVRNQVGSVAITVGYLVIGENLLALVLRLGDDSTVDPSWVSRLSSFLPGNAGDVAIYERAVGGIADPDSVRTALELLAGVAAPPAGWVSLLVLLAWTVAMVALAVVVGGRRDVT